MDIQLYYGRERLGDIVLSPKRNVARNNKARCPQDDIHSHKYQEVVSFFHCFMTSSALNF
jgi:hypothetical protein